jgi:HK97 family phage portal protein
VAEVLSYPNQEQTPCEVRELMVLSLLLRGNAICVLDIGGNGQVTAMRAVPADRFHIERVDGKLRYGVLTETGWQAVPRERVWHVSGLSLDDPGIGVGVVTLARLSMEISQGMRQSNTALHRNGMPSNLVLSMADKISDEQVEHLRAQWKQTYAGADNHHKPLILEGGMSASSLRLTNKDAEYIEQAKFQLEEVARWFAVPPHMLGLNQRSTHHNVEEMSRAFVKNTLRPWLTRFEQTAARDLLTSIDRQRGLFVHHDADALLRGDTLTRYRAYEQALGVGWLSRAEVRDMENLPPREGLGFAQPGQQTALDRALRDALHADVELEVRAERNRARRQKKKL